MTDIDSRHATYEAMLSRLTLASDHRANLVSRGLSEEKIITLGYKTTPIVGMKTLAKQLLAEGFYLSGVPDSIARTGNGHSSMRAEEY